MRSLVLLLALLPPGPARPPPGAAPQKELDVLVFGVLQLSQALHETYSATGQQLEQAGRRLRLCQHSLGALWHQVRQARQGAEELHGAVQGLKAEELALRLQTHGGAQALQGVQAGHLLLAERLTELERMLAGLARRGPRHRAVELAALKTHVEQQSLTLQALAGMAQHQQQRAARQAEQLARLREQLQHRTRTGVGPPAPPCPTSTRPAGRGDGPGASATRGQLAAGRRGPWLPRASRPPPPPVCPGK